MAKKQPGAGGTPAPQGDESTASEETRAGGTPGTKEADPARARQSAAPFCPYHPDQRCGSRGSTPFFTRYYCPVKGCTFSVKQPRPEMRTRLHQEEEDFSAR